MVFHDGSIASMTDVSASPAADLEVDVRADEDLVVMRFVAKDHSWCFEQTMDADETDAVIAALLKQRKKIS